MATPLDQLIQHIQDNGGHLEGDPIIDGKWHNIPANQGKKGNKSFGYIAFANPDGSIGGKIKNYYIHDEQGESFIFTPIHQNKTLTEKSQLEEKIDNLSLRLLLPFKIDERNAIYQAAQLYSTYRKGIQTDSLKKQIGEILNINGQIPANWQGQLKIIATVNKNDAVYLAQENETPSSWRICLEGQEINPIHDATTIDAAETMTRKLNIVEALSSTNPLLQLEKLYQSTLADDIKARNDENKRIYDDERKKKANAAQIVYKNSDAAPSNHPYLTRKQILPHLAKINQKGQLIIPLINEEGNIQTLEFIAPDGTKKLMTGGKAVGTFAPLGFRRDRQESQIIIAEGFATAASIYEATGIATVHARGKGNIEHAAAIMATRHPHAQLIIAADNDKNKPSNYGLDAAKNIQSKQPNVIILLPPIEGDFNDFAVHHGQDRLRSFFANSLNNQYITESKAYELLRTGEYDQLLNAARTDNIDMTPALLSRMLEVPNAQFNAKILEIGLNDPASNVREAAAQHLIRTNEGAPGANFSSIPSSSIETIKYDASPISQLASIQTQMDKEGKDLPDHISMLITSWKQEITQRQNELGLSDKQIIELGEIFKKSILENQEKKIFSPKEIKSPNKEKKIIKEQGYEY